MGELVELWIQILVPTMLLLIMISMGLELGTADFRRVLKYPRAAAVGLFGQIIVLPLLGIAFASLSNLSPSLAVSAIFLVVLAVAFAFVLARLARLDRRDSFTISIEVGLQNGALATLVITNLLQRPDLMIFPGAYAVLAFFPVALWTLAFRNLLGAKPVAIIS